MYSENSNILSSQYPWKNFWRTKALMKILITVWKIWHNAILAFSTLNHHRFICDIFTLSMICRMILLLTFFNYHFDRAIWFGISVAIKIGSRPTVFKNGSSFGSNGERGTLRFIMRLAWLVSLSECHLEITKLGLLWLLSLVILMLLVVILFLLVFVNSLNVSKFIASSSSNGSKDYLGSALVDIHNI